MNKKSLVILFLIIIFFLFLRLPQILTDNFAFVFDMGRDMLWTRDIVVLHKPYLIGPWGSLNGIFFGPFWYYLLAIPFVVTGGDPRGSVLLVMILNLATAILAFFLGRKVKDEKIGFIFITLICSSSLLISLSTFAFHSNLLPLTTLLLVWCLFEITQKKIIFFIPASLLTSLNFHLEPAAAIFTTLTLVIFAICLRKQLSKNINYFLTSIIAFFIPFIPQIIFELRHNFLQTRSLFAYFSGKNESLGGVLPLGQRIGDRFDKFIKLFSSSVVSAQPRWLVTCLLAILILIVLLNYKQSSVKLRNFIKVNLLVLLVPFLAYIFLFPPELKNWYLYGLTVPIIFLTGLGIDYLCSKITVFGFLFIIFLVIINTNIIGRVKQYFNKENNASGPETIKNQKKVVDWIYQNSTGKPFDVYTYTAPIYDYHYQYLFWWYGRKKYNYWPEEYSYLPGKIDYVPFKSRYIEIQKNFQASREAEQLYLIIEPDIFPERIKNWLSFFSKNILIKKEEFNSGVIIEERKNSQIAVK